MSNQGNEITPGGIVGVILLMVFMALCLIVVTKLLEWLTVKFSFAQLFVGFFMLIPAAFFFKYLSEGSFFLAKSEIDALHWGISILLLLVFGATFGTLANLLMPDALREAHDRGGIVFYVVGVIGGLTMMISFATLMQKLALKAKLRSLFEGYSCKKRKP